MNDIKVKYVIWMLIAIMLLAASTLTAEATGRKDPPIVHTTPKISYQGSMARISWYNTTPKIYTVIERYEKCTPKVCMLLMRIRYRKFLGIGNVRINVNRPLGQITVY